MSNNLEVSTTTYFKEDNTMSIVTNVKSNVTIETISVTSETICGVGYRTTIRLNVNGIDTVCEHLDNGVFEELKINLFDNNGDLMAVAFQSTEAAVICVDDTISFDLPSEHKEIQDAIVEYVFSYEFSKYSN